MMMMMGYHLKSVEELALFLARVRSKDVTAEAEGPCRGGRNLGVLPCLMPTDSERAHYHATLTPTDSGPDLHLHRGPVLVA